MDVDEIINNLIDRYWNWRLLDIPEFATYVGVHKYDDRLQDISLNGFLRRRDDVRAWSEEAKVIRQITKTSPPTNDTMIHLDYLEHDLQTYLEGFKHQTYLCPLNQMDGPHFKFPRVLSWMRRESVADYQLILTRCRQFPRQICQMIELMNEGIRLGKTAHLKTVEPIPEAFLKVSRQKVIESKLFVPFKSRPDSISTEEWTCIIKEATAVVSNLVLPCFKRFSDFVRYVYITKTRPNIGVGTLPDGRAVYEAYVRFHTDGHVTAKHMYEMAQQRLKMLLEKFDEAQKKVHFKGSRQEFMTYLRTDPSFGFTSREEMIVTYENRCREITCLLPKIFAKMPRMEVKIVQAPTEVEKTYCCGAYVAGDTEKNRPGHFVLNTYSPSNRKRYDVTGLVLHEALPGHHVQLALTAESGLKDYRRFADELRLWDHPAHVGMKSAYHEGWATYAEYLGHELGLYQGPYEYIGSLSRELELACRPLMDIELHLNGWSEKQAKEFMMANCACDEIDIVNEITRYIALPAQSMSYLYGCEKMKEFRRRAEQALGDAFDVRVYHDMVASLGDVPLFIVENQVDKHISDYGQQAA